VGVHAREVEDVVDEAEQRAAAGVDDGELVAQVRRHVGLGQ